MNLLLYVSGWWFGAIIVKKYLYEKGTVKYNAYDLTITANTIMWTMTWIWICWKFIS